MKKILVVDNHPMMLKFMSNLLGKKGYRVWTATDGLSALNILKTQVPDVIFVDLVMPNISGKKLCRIIRNKSEFKKVFLVILSAVAAEESAHLSDNNADACIAKGPFNKMAEHVLAVLSYLQTGRVGELKGKIIGREKIYEREITKELLASKKHFEATLNNISEGILELTTDLKIVYLNPAAISIMGAPEVNLLSADFTNFFHEKHRKRIRDLIENPEEEQRAIPHDESFILNKKQVTLDILPLQDDAHKTILVILNDVTRRKQMEAQLQHAQRMEAIGILAAGVAHEINNPINGVIGYAEILKDRLQEKETQEDIPSKIIKEADRIAEIVKNLLSFARDRQEEYSPARVKDILSNTLSLIERRMVKDGITFDVDVSENLPEIKARSHEIQQVFLNILSNSRYVLNQRYPGFDEDKFIKIKSETTKVEGQNYIRTIFYDSGPGIPKNVLNKICDPFFSTKPPGEGTGLGLSISHSIIRNHGGRLLFDTMEEAYTKVIVELPTVNSDLNEHRQKNAGVSP